MADAIFIIELICAICISYSFFIGVSEIVVGHWNAQYKQIKREWRLLGDLLEDYKQVKDLENKMKLNAHQLFYSELVQLLLTLKPNPMQKRWLQNAEELVSYIQRFRDLKKTRKFLMWFASALVYLPQMYDVLRSMKSSKFLIWRKNTCAEIYGLLEESRSKVRSLLDRSIEFKSTPPPRVCLTSADHELLVSSLVNTAYLREENGMNEKIDFFIMELELLHAFTKDIQRLRSMETEMEVSWVKAAHKAINKAKAAIDTLRMRTVANSKSRRRIKKDLSKVCTRISELLESKERYGFKFIRRESSSKSETLHQTSTDIDTDFLIAVRNFHNWLNQPQMKEGVSPACVSLRKKLESLQKLFEDTKATEYACNARYACLKRLTKLLEVPEAGRFLHIQLQDLDQYLSEFIKGIEDGVSEIQRRMKVYSIEAVKESCSVIGLGEDVHELVRKLTTDSEGDSVISILGMKGVGKSTLAMEVLNHGAIRNHFEVRCLVAIPPWSTENALYKKIRRRVPPELDQEKQDGNYLWTKKVIDFLRIKKCLLVFDNVSSKETFKVLATAFPPAEITNGSKIVYTTQSKAFAEYQSSQTQGGENGVIQCYPLRLRTQRESWEIFTQMVEISSEKEWITNAKKVVGKTGGLPLLIFCLGYLLSHKPVTSEELLRFHESITYGWNQTPWLDTQAMNKDDLQKGYFEVFPGGDFEIPARRLAALSAAKGLASDQNTGYRYLLELIDRNMIQLVQRKPNGDVKTCRLPSALRELLLRDNGNTSTTRTWSLSTSSDQKHIAYHFDENDGSFSRINGLNTNSPSVLQSGSYPHTIIFFDTREGKKTGQEIGHFLHRSIARGFLAQLQVLDLERVFKPQLPKSIGKLKHLTYLGLRWTYIRSIPASVGNLESLETLDLKHTDLPVLPSSIWKLKKLRHLYLDRNCKIRIPNRAFPISTGNLQTLRGVFVDKGNLLKYHWDKLKELQKLGLAFRLEEQTVLTNWIKQLRELQSLKLTSVDERSVPQLLKLNSLLNLEKLSNLYLCGKLETPQPFISELPHSLTQITLSATEISEVSMPILGKLPKLKSLSLFSKSYFGTAMVFSIGDFPQLFVLKLWNLEFLETLNVEEGSMRNLREMEIRSCSNLATATGLTGLKILQEIKLTNMPKTLTGDIEDDFSAAGKIHSLAIKIEYW